MKGLLPKVLTKSKTADNAVKKKSTEEHMCTGSHEFRLN